MSGDEDDFCPMCGCGGIDLTTLEIVERALKSARIEVADKWIQAELDDAIRELPNIVIEQHTW